MQISTTFQKVFSLECFKLMAQCVKASVPGVGSVVGVRPGFEPHPYYYFVQYDSALLCSVLVLHSGHFKRYQELAQTKI